MGRFHGHHGSLQYWPHRRARNRLPRMRSSPTTKEPGLCNIIAYKVGMTHIGMIDDSESPAKNQEVAKAVTVLEFPKMEIYGARFYHNNSDNGYSQVKTELFNKAIAQKLNMKKLKNDESKLEAMKQNIKDYKDITALVVAYPKETSTGQKHPVRFESPLGGAKLEEKFDAISKSLGKEVKVNEVFKPGEFVDVISVSTGKGWAGSIKRFHVKRNFHKATNKIRHGGPLGAYSPGKVFFTKPRPGQMGFNYRTEHNKRILKIGQKADAQSVNPPAGFQEYGLVDNDFIVIDGSVPGTTKRLVRLRKSIRDRNKKGIKEPKINYIAK